MAASPVFLDLLSQQARMRTISKWTTFQSLDHAWNDVVSEPNEDFLLDLADVAIDLIVGIHGAATRTTVTENIKAIHVRKNAGYAGAENPDPWANFRLAEAFGITPLDGVLVRMSDKYSRLTSLRRNPDNEQTGESILDTLIDLASYALIAVCLLREEREAVAA